MRIIVTTLFVLCLGLSNTKAQNEEIQSSIFYYLSNYIEWPEEKSSGDFIIGIVGSDPILPYLKKMAEVKKVKKRNIVVKEFADVKDAAESHIIFLCDDKLDQFSFAIAVSTSMGSLLVTDAEGYGSKGSAINFTVKEGKTAYQINESMINSAGLKASGRLLSLGLKI